MYAFLSFRTNIGVDMLKCLCCQKVMAATIDQSLNPTFRANVVSALRAQLISAAHAPLCPWRDSPVPLALLQLSGSSVNEVLRETQLRLDSLRRCTKLPALAPEFLRSQEYRRIVDAVGWPPGRRSVTGFVPTHSKSSVLTFSPVLIQFDILSLGRMFLILCNTNRSSSSVPLHSSRIRSESLPCQCVCDASPCPGPRPLRRRFARPAPRRAPTT